MRAKLRNGRAGRLWIHDSRVPSKQPRILPLWQCAVRINVDAQRHLLLRVAKLLEYR
jgi:hypothetical protein